MGSGRGYWLKLLKQRGVDIIGIEKELFEMKNSKIWTKLHYGGPHLLSQAQFQGRNLFLCYPDDAQGLGVECLEIFKGNFVIHVGEMITTGGTVCGGGKN